MGPAFKSPPGSVSRLDETAPRAPRPASPDAFVVPALLLLIARDLCLHDPPRVLAWRLLHEPSLQDLPGFLAWLLPRAPEGFDRDPLALLLAGLATTLAFLYLALAIRGAGARARLAVIATASVLVVVIPTLAFVGMGARSDSASAS